MDDQIVLTSQRSAGGAAAPEMLINISQEELGGFEIILSNILQ